MASGNTGSIPLCQRKMSRYKKIPNEKKNKIILQLKEMFESVIDTDLIENVAENCNWDVDASIEALISMSDSKDAENCQKQQTDKTGYFNQINYNSATDNIKSNNSLTKSDNLQYNEKTPEKFPLLDRKGFVPENNFTSFSSYASKTKTQVKEDNQNFEDQVNRQLSHFHFSHNTLEKSLKDLRSHDNKVETESLCGLKIQYRPRGVENTSDDDADVVIEGESSDYKFGTSPEERVNVCQFLSSPAECPPKNTFRKMNYASTPSPSSSPRSQQTSKDKTLQIIEKHIEAGYKILILMRGVPGSGKTHLARNIIAKYCKGNYSDYIYSSDDYFIQTHNGVYKYDPNKLHEAHSYNQNRVLKSMQEGRSPLIIDNTNTQAWEMRQYVLLGVNYGYIVETLEPVNPWNHNARELAKRNIHNVPKEKIQLKLDRYEPNVSGKRLLQMFSYDYSPQNRPPQFRKIPPIPIKQAEEHQELKNKTPVHTNDSTECIQKKVDNSYSLGEELINKMVMKSKDNFENNGNESEKLKSSGLANLNAIGSERKYHNVEIVLRKPYVINEAGYETDNVKRQQEGVLSSQQTSPSRKIYGNIIGKTDDSPLLEDLECIEKPLAITYKPEDYCNISKDICKIPNKLAQSSQPHSPVSSTSQRVLVNDGKETHDVFINTDGIVNFRGKKYGTSKIDFEVESIDSDEGFLQTIFREDGINLKISQIIESTRNDESYEPVHRMKLVNDGTTTHQLFMNSEGTVYFEGKKFNILETAASLLDGDELFVNNVFRELDADKKIPQFSISPRKSSNDSDKTLDVDISQYELCNSPSSDENIEFVSLNETNFENPSKNSVDTLTNSIEVTHQESSERINDSSSTLGTFLKFIKKSIIGDNYSTDENPNIDGHANYLETDNNQSKQESVHKEYSLNQLSDKSDTNFDLIQNLNEFSDVIEKNNITKHNLCPNTSKTLGKENYKINISAGEWDKSNKPEKYLINKCDNYTTSSLSCKNLDSDINNYNIENISESSSSIKVDKSNVLSVRLDENSEENSDSTSSENTDREENEHFTLKEIKSNELKEIVNEMSKALSEIHIKEQESNKTVNEFTENDSENKLNSYNINEDSADENKVLNFDINYAMTDSSIVAREEASYEPSNDNYNERLINQATNTTAYDFNISYLGGIGDPEFKVIDAFSRDINNKSPNVISNVQNSSPFRVNLDKGTMTNKTSVIFDGDMFNLEVDGDANDDRTDLLIQLFPKIPVTYITNLYTQLCKYDFDFAVDHLRSLTPDCINYIHAEDSKTVSSSRKLSSEEGLNDIQLSARIENSSEDLMGNKNSDNTDEMSHNSKDYVLLINETENKIISNDLSISLQDRQNKKQDLEMVQNSQIQHSLFRGNDLIASEIPETLNKNNISDLQDEACGLSDSKTISPNSFITNEFEEQEETVKLYLGHQFIKSLENVFGFKDYEIPMGISPIIQIRKSMAQELHALWIESLQQQIIVKQDELDKMIQKDAELAKSLEQENSESQVPNLKEIMEMEMAYDSYKNNNKPKVREINKDIEHQIAQKVLQEMFPDYDMDVIHQIYEAHDRNFNHTVKVIEANSGKSGITMADILKKRKNLIDQVKKESNDRSAQNQLDTKEDYEELSYGSVLQSGHNSRAEARKQLMLRDENYQKAMKAHQKRNPEVAAYYADMAKLHVKNMEQANSEAASAFLAAQAYIFDENNTLDLHNLYVNEALEALDIFLDAQLEKLKKSNKNTLQFYVVTGRGARSANGQSKIKPAVTKKLANRNIKFSEANPGCLKITLYTKISS